MPEIDDRDRELFAKRLEAWNARQGPRVGDFIYRRNGTLHRFTYHWGDAIQTTSQNQPGDASFHMFSDGTLSFSGSLDPSIPLNRIELYSDEMRPGWIWFFHHDSPGASRGVRFSLPCRVYRELAP